nr:HSP=66 kda major heat shock protein {N-terminal} [Helicobacter pylori, ATCC43504, Peptide Partial, 20 aa] [Helicobacter pylori]
AKEIKFSDSARNLLFESQRQ